MSPKRDKGCREAYPDKCYCVVMVAEKVRVSRRNYQALFFGQNRQLMTSSARVIDDDKFLVDGARCSPRNFSSFAQPYTPYLRNASKFSRTSDVSANGKRTFELRRQYVVRSAQRRNTASIQTFLMAETHRTRQP